MAGRGVVADTRAAPEASLRGPLVHPATAAQPSGSGQHLLQQHGPANQGVAAPADTGLDRQVEITAFMDEAADFGGGLGDVDQQRMTAGESPRAAINGAETGRFR